MIHSSAWQPKVFPHNGDISPTQIDRLQSFDAGSTLNREKIREIGRDGIVDWRKRIPSSRVTLKQFEYGDLEFYRKLANKSDGTNTITLPDFKTSMVDICGYKTDDNGTFLGTVWYPKLRVAGFGISIGDPQAYIERNFSLVGEDENILEYNNKYFNYQRLPSASPAANESFTVNAPAPVLDPDNSGQYFLKVLRVNVSAGTTDELTYSTTTTVAGTTTFNSTATTVKCATVAGDVVKVYYSAATWNAVTLGATQFTNNDSDASALPAENSSIYLYDTSNHYVYKLQSIGIDVSFDRTDYYEIGNTDVVQRGVRDKTVKVTLGRILEAYTIEEALRGVGTTFGRLNTRKYLDNGTLRVKVYGNSMKNTFNIGFKINNLSPTDLGNAVPLNDYSNRNVTLEADNLSISTTESVIDAA